MSSTFAAVPSASNPADSRARTAALIPVRSISGSKNRLASWLSAERREQLALAMLEDMLCALGAAESVRRVVVVSADPRMREHAHRFGAESIDEERPRGLNPAVTMAAERLASEGVRRLLTIPGDVPLLDPVEIDAMFSVNSERYPVVAAPSAALTGTNGLLTAGPTVIPFRFEGHSLGAYRDTCREAGVEMLTLALEGFAVDVDTPDDLLSLPERDDRRTCRLAAEWRDDLLRATEATGTSAS